MKSIELFKDIIDERIAAWMELGIYESGDRMPRHMQKRLTGVYKTYPTTLSQDRVILQLAIKTARDLKRPFVSAFEVKEFDHLASTGDKKVLKPYRMILRVKNQKRTAPLIAALMLYGQNMKEMSGGRYREQAIESGLPATWWAAKPGQTMRVDFFDSFHYAKFRDRCKRDPEFRKVLEGRK